MADGTQTVLRLSGPREAQVGQMRNDIEVVKANYRQKQEAIKSDQVQVAYYETEFQRQAELVAKSFASRQTYDTARRNLDAARQTLAGDRQQLAGIVAQ